MERLHANYYVKTENANIAEKCPVSVQPSHCIKIEAFPLPGPPLTSSSPCNSHPSYIYIYIYIHIVATTK